MAYDYKGETWDSLTYEDKNGVSKIKASAARNGATIEGAIKVLGQPPKTMKLGGYNPNIAAAQDYQDAKLATDLGLLNSSGTGSPSGSTNAMTSSPSGYKLTSGSTVDPLQAKINALTEERRGLTETSNKMGGLASNAARIEQINAELNTLTKQMAKQDATQAGGVANFGFNNTSAPKPDAGVDLFGSAWANTPTQTATQMANNVTGAAATAATGNNLANNPGAQQGIIDAAQGSVINNAASNLTAGGAAGTVNSNGTSANPLPAAVAMLPSAVGAADSAIAGMVAGNGGAAAPIVMPGMAGAAGTVAGTAAGAAGGAAAGAGGAALGGVLGGAAVPLSNAIGNAVGGAVSGGMDAATLAALIASGALGAGTSLAAAQEQAKAQVEAAKIQADAALAAGQITKDMYDKWLEQSNTIYQQSRADLEPWRNAGKTALTDLQNFEANNPAFQDTPFEFNTTGANADPSYTFRFDEGIKALERSVIGRMGVDSGAANKALVRYGQDAASQEYSNAFNRYQTDRANRFNIHQSQKGMKLNNLQGLAGIGQTAVQQMTALGQNQSNATGQASQNTAGAMGGAQVGAANAMANGMTGAASSNASGWMGGANAATGALSTWLNYNNSNNMANAMLMGRR